MSQFSEIEVLEPSEKEFNSINTLVAADLEAIITPEPLGRHRYAYQGEGLNEVYMAAWYNGTSYKIFNISQWGYNTNTMLEHKN